MLVMGFRDPSLENSISQPTLLGKFWNVVIIDRYVVRRIWNIGKFWESIEYLIIFNFTLIKSPST